MSYYRIYEDRGYGQARVEFKGGKLHLSLIPAAELFTSPLVHWHLNTFRIRFKGPMLPAGFVIFSFNAAGSVSGFAIDLKNPDLHFHQLDFRRRDP